MSLPELTDDLRANFLAVAALFHETQSPVVESAPQLVIPPQKLAAEVATSPSARLSAYWQSSLGLLTFLQLTHSQFTKTVAGMPSFPVGSFGVEGASTGQYCVSSSSLKVWRSGAWSVFNVIPSSERAEIGFLGKNPLYFRLA